jgi:Zn-finger nucleic acid-binding protein
MKCPTCKETSLAMTDRQGIEIDYCPECRGVWLDRGELDKLIERAERPRSDTAGRGREPVRQERPYRDAEYRHKPRKSFLSELFD